MLLYFRARRGYALWLRLNGHKFKEIGLRLGVGKQAAALLYKRAIRDAELKIETIALIQARADKVLNQEEWVVIDGVDKPKP